jgi:hypothetical protein
MARCTSVGRELLLHSVHTEHWCNIHAMKRLLHGLVVVVILASFVNVEDDFDNDKGNTLNHLMHLMHLCIICASYICFTFEGCDCKKCTRPWERTMFISASVFIIFSLLIANLLWIGRVLSWEVNEPNEPCYVCERNVSDWDTHRKKCYILNVIFMSRLDEPIYNLISTQSFNDFTISIQLAHPAARVPHVQRVPPQVAAQQCARVLLQVQQLQGESYKRRQRRQDYLFRLRF